MTRGLPGRRARRATALRVRRAYAAELNAIRDGALTFDQLQNLANELQAKMLDAVKTTALPADVEAEFVEQLAFDVITAGRR